MVIQPTACILRCYSRYDLPKPANAQAQVDIAKQPSRPVCLISQQQAKDYTHLLSYDLRPGRAADDIFDIHVMSGSLDLGIEKR